jgi:hypothetical protein
MYIYFVAFYIIFLSFCFINIIFVIKKYFQILFV